MKDKIFGYITDNFTFAYENLSVDDFKDLVMSVLRLCINHIQFLLSN